MGQRGPAPTPSALLRLRGTDRPDRVRPDEPQPETAPSVDPPSWLDRAGRREWRAKAPELHRLGLLTVLDVDELAAYCVERAHYLAVQKRLRELGAADRRLARDQRRARSAGDAAQTSALEKARLELGGDMDRLVRRSKRHFEMARTIAARFGFTPSDRRHISAPAPKEAGSETAKPNPTRAPFASFLARRRARQQQGTA